jgi:hypothetical protein
MKMRRLLLHFRFASLFFGAPKVLLINTPHTHSVFHPFEKHTPSIYFFLIENTLLTSDHIIISMELVHVGKRHVSRVVGHILDQE